MPEPPEKNTTAVCLTKTGEEPPGWERWRAVRSHIQTHRLPEGHPEGWPIPPLALSPSDPKVVI